MIAIIPARGGSKGVPGKNIKMLCGKPLIAYTIEAALKSDYIDKIIVTTDSLEIAEIAKKYGAEVPFIRPYNLAGDTSGAVDVYLHAVSFLESHMGVRINQFVVLLPTAPMRTEKHINDAVELFNLEKPDSLISMKEADTPPAWYFEMDDKKRVKNADFDSSDVMSNRQANRKFYVPNGAIYILNHEMLERERTYYSNKTIAYVMDPIDSIDIDTQMDFDFAEYLMSRKNNRQ